MFTLLNFDHAIETWCKERYTYSVWGDPSTAFKNAGMEFGDKVPLPLVSVYRSDLNLANSRNFALFKTGNINSITTDKIRRERILPVLMSYQIDIWASAYDQAVQMFSELLFRIMDNPKVTVRMDGEKEAYDTYFNVTEIVDNSDTSQISTRGRLNRLTIITQVDGYIMNSYESDRINIVPEFRDFSGNELK